MVYEPFERARRWVPPGAGPLSEAANLVSSTVSNLSRITLELAEEDRKRLERAMKNLQELGKSLWIQLGTPPEFFKSD